MSELPPGWAWTRVGDLGDEIRESVRPRPDVEYELYSVPAFSLREPEIIDGSDIGSTKRAVNPGDVLICKINPRINRVWIVGERRERVQIASPEYLILRTPARATAEYLRWYLSSPRFRAWITLSVEGATGSHTRAKSGPILRQPVPLPPLEEQRRIVAAIEEHLSRLDGALQDLGHAGTRLSQYRASALTEAVANWPERSLGDFSRVFVGTTPSRSRPELWGGGVPWVSSGEVAFCHITATRETIASNAVSAERVHPPGTVLLGMIGEGRTRGQAAILDVPAAHNQNSAAIRLDPAVCMPGWLFYVLMARYEETRAAGSGGQQPALNSSRVAALRVPLPPLEEQRALIALIEKRLSRAAGLEQAVQHARQRASLLRNAVLARAFSGELAPQDPDDEPAQALLEQIMADRSATPAPTRKRRMRTTA